MTDALQKLLEDLADVVKPDLVYPHVMTREEEELLHGVKDKPSKRGGRMPALYRAEVDAIRQDERPAHIIASSRGIAIDTVRRVKGLGKFAGVPYIPRDEIDRRVNYSKDGTRTHEQRPMSSYVVTSQGKKGRPFKTGRVEPVSDAERRAIATDLDDAETVAKKHNISKSYVLNIRATMGTSHIRRGPIAQAVMIAISKDRRDARQVAEAYHVPVSVVEAIRGGSFENG